MPQSFAAMYVHIIFSTKHREPMIERVWQGRLYDYLGGICKQQGYSLLCAGGVADHVHLLVSMGRESSIAEIVRTLKSNSSKWIHQEFPQSAAFGRQAATERFR